MLSGKLAASLLGSVLTGRGIIRAGVKVQLEEVKTKLEQMKIFNADPSLKK